ncbi:MAG: hypothetical protein AAFN70_01415, partial [Planctomycetota bacterium]
MLQLRSRSSRQLYVRLLLAAVVTCTSILPPVTGFAAETSSRRTPVANQTAPSAVDHQSVTNQDNRTEQWVVRPGSGTYPAPAPTQQMMPAPKVRRQSHESPSAIGDDGFKALGPAIGGGVCRGDRSVSVLRGQPGIGAAYR